MINSAIKKSCMFVSQSRKQWPLSRLEGAISDSPAQTLLEDRRMTRIPSYLLLVPFAVSSKELLYGSHKFGGKLQALRKSKRPEYDEVANDAMDFGYRVTLCQFMLSGLAMRITRIKHCAPLGWHS